MTALASAGTLRNHVGAGARFVGSYGVAKAAAFGGPLVLARLLTPAEYGTIELALAVGQLIAVVASLGLPLAVPQICLVLGRRHIEDLLAVQVLCVAAGAALLSLVIWHAPFASAVPLGATLAGLFAAQSALSVYCRVRQLRTLSGWVDNLCLIVVPAMALGDLASGRRDALALAETCGPVLLLVGAVALAVLYRHRQPDFAAAYRDALARGGPMMVNALMVFGVTASLRLFLGICLPLDDVAVYSLCARICLALVVLHQLAVTGLFTQIYTLPAERCDRWFASCLGGLVLVGALLTVGAGEFAAHGSWGTIDMAAFAHVFPIACAQTVLWIVSAWLDMLLNREGLAGRSALLLGAVLGGFAASVAGLEALGGFTLVTANLAFAGFLLAGVLGQLALLARSGVPLPRLTRTVWLVPALALPALL